MPKTTNISQREDLNDLINRLEALEAIPNDAAITLQKNLENIKSDLFYLDNAYAEIEKLLINEDGEPSFEAEITLNDQTFKSQEILERIASICNYYNKRVNPSLKSSLFSVILLLNELNTTNPENLYGSDCPLKKMLSATNASDQIYDLWTDLNMLLQNHSSLTNNSASATNHDDTSSVQSRKNSDGLFTIEPNTPIALSTRHPSTQNLSQQPKPRNNGLKKYYKDMIKWISDHPLETFLIVSCILAAVTALVFSAGLAAPAAFIGASLAIKTIMSASFGIVAICLFGLVLCKKHNQSSKENQPAKMICANGPILFKLQDDHPSTTTRTISDSNHLSSHATSTIQKTTPYI